MSDSEFISACLRTMVQSDLELVRGWRNHPVVRRSMYSQHEIGIDEHRSWFLSASAAQDRVLLILEINGSPCGHVNFSRYLNGEWRWGFYTAPNMPKGTGTILGQLAMNYAFDILDLSCVWGEVLFGNIVSQRYHVKLGFTLHDVLPELTVGHCRFRNVYRYVLTRALWGMHKENR